MTTPIEILVPIRYPLTVHSTRTLEFAQQLAQEQAEEAHMYVLHVNLFHYYEDVKKEEIRQAIKPILNKTPITVLTRQGFLVEETILDEASKLEIDIIVIGENQHTWWRRLLARLFNSGPSISSYLQENTGHIDVNVVKSA